MAIQFQCPSCSRKLQVPEGAAGKKAKCPACGSIILIPPPLPTGPVSEAPPWGESPTQAPASDAATPHPPGSADLSFGDAQRGTFYGAPPRPAHGFPYVTEGSPYAEISHAKSKVSGPATWLIVLSITHIVLASIMLLLVGLGLTAAGAAAKDPNFAADEDLAGTVVSLFFNFVTLSAGLVCAVVILVGAIQMKKLRNYGLAMAAAILSVIPCTSPCCFLIGLPIGIWAIIVLSEPVVKRAYQ